MKILALLLTFLSACSLDTTGLTATPVAPSLRGSVDASPGVEVGDPSALPPAPDSGIPATADSGSTQPDRQDIPPSGSTDGGPDLTPVVDASSGAADIGNSGPPSECPIDGLRSLSYCDARTQRCIYPTGLMVGCIAEGRLCVAVCP